MFKFIEKCYIHAILRNFLHVHNFEQVVGVDRILHRLHRRFQNVYDVIPRQITKRA